MNFVILFYALIYLCISVQSEAVGGSKSKQCYKAKTCVHNNHEKCGISSKGTPRRFLDLCDIFEYNCLKNTDFVKSKMEKCSHLESLYKQEQKTLNWDYGSEQKSNEVYANNFQTDPDASISGVYENNFESQYDYNNHKGKGGSGYNNYGDTGGYGNNGGKHGGNYAYYKDVEYVDYGGVGGGGGNNGGKHGGNYAHYRDVDYANYGGVGGVGGNNGGKHGGNYASYGGAGGGGGNNGGKHGGNYAYYGGVGGGGGNNGGGNNGGGGNGGSGNGDNSDYSGDYRDTSGTDAS